MKYAFIDSMESLTFNNGIRVQALMWKKGLEKLGHEVVLVNYWDCINYEEFDAIIIFYIGSNVYKLITHLYEKNKNIILAPILDPNKSDKIYRFLFRYYGCKKLGISNHLHDLWLVKNKVKLWLVRSNEEFHYVNYCLGITKSQIAKIPLNYRVPEPKEECNKENFCLHVSRLNAPNKNVTRLIKAAQKYNFNLLLAGPLYGQPEEKEDFLSHIKGFKNIRYLGEVSDEELLCLYQRAKVFALPSLREGVGMVALEAAVYGCEIVLTNIGAPKEYYDGNVLLVNPFNIDDIGQSILLALNKGYSQPFLKKYVCDKYNEGVCCSLLNEKISKSVK